jgi:mercuric ion binding protein
MKKLLFVALAGSAALMPAIAAEKTVVLSVPGMSCDLCPITIKKAISKVPGVKSVEASYEKKQAIVTFDDARTTLDALTKATANAGYPSSLTR